ncbi:hypothetical protein L4D06_08645 [Enterovibrio makurazakiensis]|uniref:hypothetical protein n=1 Tax=Enterovibrio makurazakiensis TaxID=2910232 RepID=UPI003D1CA0CE
MDITTIAAGATLLDFLNKSLETSKLIQSDDACPEQLKHKLVDLNMQLSRTSLEASQLMMTIAHKNDEIRQLRAELEKTETIKYCSQTEMYWKENEESPFCTKCFESAGKIVHLRFYEARPDSGWGLAHEHYHCILCSSSYLKTTRK